MFIDKSNLTAARPRYTPLTFVLTTNNTMMVIGGFLNNHTANSLYDIAINKRNVKDNWGSQARKNVGEILNKNRSST